MAVDKQDNCVEIHIGRSGLYYRIGKVNYTSKTIDWIRSGTLFCRGSYRNCSVALDESGNCLATYTDSNSRLAYSVGKLNDGKIDWSVSSQYEQGNLTSVTLDSEGNCLETHLKCNRLYYCQGLLNSDNKTVNWGESIQYSENNSGKYTFTSVASDSQGNCFQTYVQAGRPNRLFYCSTQIKSKTKTLWQIGKEKSRDEIEHKSGSWEKERNYAVGMDNEPIDNPNLPELISIANTPDDVLSAESVQIYFTLDQAYDPDILTLFYGYFGEEENRIFLDGQLLFKDFGISSTAIRHNRIPFPRIGAGEHILKIKVIGKRKGYHTICYLKLEALEEELEPTPTIVLYDVVMPISG